MRRSFKPRLIIVSDRKGDILYPVRLMRDELGISQRQILIHQATRETMPREVTPKAMALPERRGGWLNWLRGLMS
jgi:hypothetical protein